MDPDGLLFVWVFNEYKEIVDYIHKMQDVWEAYMYNDYNEPEDDLSEAETVIISIDFCLGF